MASEPTSINSSSYAERLVSVLQVFAEGSDVLSISEISEALNLAPSSTHRILGPLVEQGLIDRAPKRRYRIGTEFFRIAALVEARYSLLGMARSIVVETAAECNETCLLGAVTSTRSGIVLAHKVDSTYPLRFKFDLLTNISPFWGSLGRAVMAWLDQGELRRAISESEPSPLTGEPIPAPAVLNAELDLIRRRGYARSVGHRAAPDAIGISAPVFDAMGAVCGALGVVTPEHRMDAQIEEKITNLVRLNAARISQRMGYSGRMLDVS